MLQAGQGGFDVVRQVSGVVDRHQGVHQLPCVLSLTCPVDVDLSCNPFKTLTPGTEAEKFPQGSQSRTPPAAASGSAAPSAAELSALAGQVVVGLLPEPALVFLARHCTC